MPTFDPNIPNVTFLKAEEMVYENVHQAIREIHHEGMNWLQNEQTIVQNIMKSTNINNQQPTVTRSVSSQLTGSNPNRESLNKEANKKLEFFLKGKK